MMFLASEFSDSEDSAKRLLSESNLKQACKFDGYPNPNALKSAITATYKEFGMPHAKGIFEVTVLEAFNSNN